MFLLSDEPLEPDRLRRELVRPDSGAVVSFHGVVRGHNRGRRVKRLEYRAYPELADRVAREILGEARRERALLDAGAAQRVGVLEPGDLGVWVGAAAAHREEAFEGCRWLLDACKSRLPVWKREHYADGGAAWLGGGEAGARSS